MINKADSRYGTKMSGCVEGRHKKAEKIKIGVYPRFMKILSPGEIILIMIEVNEKGDKKMQETENIQTYVPNATVKEEGFNQIVDAIKAIFGFFLGVMSIPIVIGIVLTIFG